MVKLSGFELPGLKLLGDWLSRRAPLDCSIALLTCLVCTGCEQEIRQYTVKKSEEARAAARVVLSEGESVAWFFKLSGPEGTLDQHLRDFGSLLQSIRFPDGPIPTYQLPAGWKESAAEPPRFRTITLPDADPPLEVAVTYLPAQEPHSLEYLKENFNRWRGQLGLSRVDSSDWFDQAEANQEVVQFQTPTHSVSLVVLLGESQEFGPTRMLTAMVVPGVDPELLARQRAGAASDAASSSGGPSGFQAEAPEGWELAPRNQFAVAAYKAQNQSGSVEITVSPVGGSALANINRWCSQVGLPPLSEVEFAKTSEPLQIGGAAGTFVTLVGEEDAIIGAVVVHGSAQWFFKGRGPKEAVLQEVERFQRYCRSVRFE